jgi:hypothetical protein
MQFGCNPEQLAVAGALLKQLAENWREYVVGSEGFLTTRNGKEFGWRKKVEWGEMVSISIAFARTFDLPA